jgi:hypothetical protein
MTLAFILVLLVLVMSLTQTFDPRPVQQSERSRAIVRMRSLLNYSEQCRLEASAREQSRVLALLNRPLNSHALDAGFDFSFYSHTLGLLGADNQAKVSSCCYHGIC